MEIANMCSKEAHQYTTLNTFFQACANENTDTIEKLISEGFDVNLHNEDDLTALQIASAQGSENVVRVLLSHGSSSDMESACPPLVQAARHGHTSILLCLLQYKANPNIETKLGVTALTAAVRSGHLSAVRCLLDNGARVNVVNSCEVSPLMIAAQYGYDSIVKMLVDRGADVNFKSPSTNFTPLMFAALNGHKRTAQILVEAGADVDALNVCEKTALHIAICRGKRGVKGYLDKKTNFKYRCEESIEGTIFEAIKNGNTQRVKDLIREDLNFIYARQDEDRVAPLMYAAIRGNLECMKLLIDAGSDINLQDELNGWTALMHAIAHGNNDVVKYLLDCDANVNIPANNGCIALYLATCVDDIDTANIRILANKTSFCTSGLSCQSSESLVSDKRNLKDWWNRFSHRFRNLKLGKTLRPTANSQSEEFQTDILQTPRAKSAFKTRRNRRDSAVKWKSEMNLEQTSPIDASINMAGFIPRSTLRSDRIESVMPPLAFDASFSFHKTGMPPGRKIPRKSPEEIAVSNLSRCFSVLTNAQSLISSNEKRKTEDNFAKQIFNASTSSADKLHLILEHFSLQEFKQVFTDEEIDLEAFLCLDDNDFLALGVTDENARLKLLSVITDMKVKIEIR